jgi:hypothetical protein
MCRPRLPLGFYYLSQDSSVGIATGYGLADQGVALRVSVGLRIFSSPRHPDRLRSIQPPIQLVPGDVSPGVKRQGREADHSPPTSAEVDLYIHSPIRLHGAVLN